MTRVGSVIFLYGSGEGELNRSQKDILLFVYFFFDFATPSPSPTFLFVKHKSWCAVHKGAEPLLFACSAFAENS